MSTALFMPPSYNGILNVVSKVTTYAITMADDVILCSGSVFTVTLPTAVGIAGKQFKVKKTDASSTNIITVATTSAQTIDGATTSTLNTRYDAMTLVSDGANWQVLDSTVAVNARYFATASAPGTNVSPNTVTYTTKDFDSHNAYSGGTYTIPVIGKYQINASIFQGATTVAAGQPLVIFIFKNGVAISAIQLNFAAVASVVASLVSDVISCAAGDTIQIKAGNGGTTPNVTASNTANYFSIERAGN